MWLGYADIWWSLTEFSTEHFGVVVGEIACI